MRNATLTQSQVNWLRENNSGFRRTEAKFGTPRREYLKHREQFSEQLARQQAARQVTTADEPEAELRPDLPTRIAKHVGGVIVLGAAMALIVYGFAVWPE